MRKEKSCGAVVYRKSGTETLFLLERMVQGHTSLPKGHVEGAETEEETARREIREETGLEVELCTAFRRQITYAPRPGVTKDVVFFLAEALPGEAVNQECEVSGIEWLPFEEALAALTYDSDRDVLAAAMAWLAKADDARIGRKIIVVGSSGSGKSTFARRLHERTGLPLTHLDLLWWRPDATSVSREDFDRALDEVLRRDEWIIDGLYTRTLETRLLACDTVIFLDLPEVECLRGIEQRVGTKRPDIPWVEERVEPELVQLVRDFHARKRGMLLELLAQHPEKQVLTFTSRADADAWLGSLPTGAWLDSLPADTGSGGESSE